MWIKSMRQLRRLTPRQLRDYYDRQLRLFWTDRMNFGNGRFSATPFQRRHQAGTFSWNGRTATRRLIDQLKAIRQLLRDGHRRDEPKAQGPGACAVDRDEERRERRPPKGERRDWAW